MSERPPRQVRGPPVLRCTGRAGAVARLGGPARRRPASRGRGRSVRGDGSRSRRASPGVPGRSVLIRGAGGPGKVQAPARPEVVRIDEAGAAAMSRPRLRAAIVVQSAPSPRSSSAMPHSESPGRTAWVDRPRPARPPAGRREVAPRTWTSWRRGASGGRRQREGRPDVVQAGARRTRCAPRAGRGPTSLAHADLAAAHVSHDGSRAVRSRRPRPPRPPRPAGTAHRGAACARHARAHRPADCRR